MSHIFISYSRRDIDFAQKIVDALAANNLDTWVDWKSIPKGEDWEQEIYRGIQEADAFLFLISPDSVRSPICTREILHAVENNKRILPIVIRPANADDFPDERAKKEISKRNWIFCKAEPAAFNQAIEQTRKTIQTDYQWLKYHTELQVKALEWEQKKDSSRLLRGKELREAEEQFAAAGNTKDPQPTELHRNYVLASQRNEVRQRRQVIIGLSVGLSAVAVLAFFAWIQRNTAVTEANSRATAESNAILEANAKATALVNEENARATAQSERSRAEEQALIAHVGELSALALSLQDEQIDVALLLSVEAISEKKTSQSLNSLYSATSAHNDLFALFRGHESSVLSVAFSRDSQLIATGDANGAIKLWSIYSRQQTGIQFAGHARWVKNLVFSSDGKILISSGCARVRNNSCEEYSVELWNTKTGQNTGSLIRGVVDEITDMALSPEGTLLAVAHSNNSIDFWDIYKRERIGKPILIEPDSSQAELFILKHVGFESIAFSPDGKTLASGGCYETFEWGCRTGELRLWDVKTRRQLGSPMLGLEDTIRSISFSPDDETIATAGCGDFIDPIAGCGIGEIILWNANTRRQVGQKMQGHKYVQSIAFSPNGKTLVSGGCQGTGYRFDASGACQQGRIIVWDIASARSTYESTFTNKAAVEEVAFSPDGNFIASASDDHTAILWDANPKNPFSYSPEYSKELSNATFSKGNIAVSGLDFLSGNPSVEKFSIATQFPLRLPGFVFPASFIGSSMAVSPDNSKLAVGGSTGGLKGKIIVYDNLTHTLILELPAGHTDSVRSLAFSPDGRLLASGGQDDQLILWDATTWKILFTYEGRDQHFTTSLAFSTNEPILISGGNDGFIVWDVLSDSLKMQSKNELEGGVSAIAFHPSETIFATGGFDNHIFLWNTAQEENAPLEKYLLSDPAKQEGWIETLVFSADGRFLLSQDFDHATSVWITDPKLWMDKNCRRAGRNLTKSEWERFLYWKPYSPEYKICPQWPEGQ